MPPLLEYLETVAVDISRTASAQFRLPVQLVVRPDHEFRGYAGQIASGAIRPGDRVTVWPSGVSARVSRIVTWDGDLDAALRADVGHADARRRTSTSAGATSWRPAPYRSAGGSRRTSSGWTSARSIPGRVYLLKHASRIVTAEVDSALALNEIGLVTVTASRPLVFDPYEDNRATGSFHR